MSASNRLTRLFAGLLLLLGMAAAATAANRTWIGGNNDWNSSSSNWTGSDEPDSNDVAIFNTPNSVHLVNTSETISGLTLSDGISLTINSGNVLSVDGTIELSNDSTDLFIDDGAIVVADIITVNSGADVTLRGGNIWILDQTGVGLIDVNDGGEMSGNGLILLDESVSAGTQVFNLDGTLSVHSTAANDILSLAFATMTVTVSDPDGVIDLDGNDGISTINILATTRWRSMAACSTATTAAPSISRPAPRSAETSLGPLMARCMPTPARAGPLRRSRAAAFTQTGGSINVDAGESLQISSVDVHHYERNDQQQRSHYLRLGYHEYFGHYV